MPTPFATLEARVNQVIINRLANTLATVDGVPVQGLFEAPHKYQQYGDQIGFESTRPTLTVPSTSVPSPAVGAAVCIGDDDYIVFAHEPNGSGLSRLILEPA